MNSSVRVATRLALIAAFLVGAAITFRLTFVPSQPNFHNFGVVHTRIGLAVVACGGEASSGCGVDTAIRFESCSARFRAYFGDPTATADQLVRTLIGKRPPSGDRWIVECGAAAAMIRGRPAARLQPI